jgi:hypothetical protein
MMRDRWFAGFLLAGGTNLALQLGYRKSIDLDFFAWQHFDALPLAEYLQEHYRFYKQDVREKDTIKGYIDNIKVDFIAHVYPFVDERIATEDGIRMYSIKDIVAMKLGAVSDNGRRLKDFVDIAYLSTRLSLTQMLGAYADKYQNSSTLHAARGLAYFDDIDFNAQIELTGNRQFDWKKIEKRILQMIRFENKIFSNEPI